MKISKAFCYVLLLGGLVLAACGGAQPASTPTPYTLTDIQSIPYFVAGQVILSGPSDKIDDVLTLAEDANVYLELDPDTGSNPISDPGTEIEQNVYEVGLYGLPNRSIYDTLHAVNVINRLGECTSESVEKNTLDEATSMKLGTVCADLNYVTEQSDFRQHCGEPFEVGGSPFEVGGSPFEVGGSPFEVGGSGAGASTAAVDAFVDQWAFHTIKLQPDLYDSNAGSHVSVAVFDTSPTFSDLNDAFDAPLNITSFQSPPAPAIPTQSAPTGSSAPSSSHLIEHGLFVTELAHAIAPAATFTLVRVLDENACGDLYTLVHELHSYMNSFDGESAIVNMSLGVKRPNDSTIGDISQRLVNSDEMAQALSGEIRSLEVAIRRATDQGVVVIAAAGNDFHQEATYPGAFPRVLSVGASNSSGQESCFTNNGELYAPGGDGQTPTPGAAPAAPPCLPANSQCQGQGGDCEYSVISMFSTGEYWYWSGTSFATPLVSGAVARLLSSNAIDVSSGVSSSTVADILSLLSAGGSLPILQLP